MGEQRLTIRGSAEFATTRTMQATAQGPWKFDSENSWPLIQIMLGGEVDIATMKGANELFFMTPFRWYDMEAQSTLYKGIQSLGYDVRIKSFPRDKELGLAFHISWPFAF